jgi:hypothetical protein
MDTVGPYPVSARRELVDETARRLIRCARAAGVEVPGDDAGLREWLSDRPVRDAVRALWRGVVLGDVPTMELR